MSWNQCLYHYYRKNGGTYYGSSEECCDGLLLLPHRDTPMVLRSIIKGAGRGYSIHHTAHTTIQLERPYELRIRPKWITSKGIGAVRSILPGGNTFGQPQLTRDRNIGASDAPFTKLVLQDLDFRNQLEKNSLFKVTVLPSGADDTLHLVTVSWESYDLFDVPTISAPFLEATVCDEKQKEASIPQIDAMLDVCYYAARAVTAYRMPQK